MGAFARLEALLWAAGRRPECGMVWAAWKQSDCSDPHNLLRRLEERVAEELRRASSARSAFGALSGEYLGRYGARAAVAHPAGATATAVTGRAAAAVTEERTP